MDDPGNKWFEWSRSVGDPNTYVLIEAFTDGGAEPHVKPEHFRRTKKGFPYYLSATPLIVSHQVEGDGWGPVGEVQV